MPDEPRGVVTAEAETVTRVASNVVAAAKSPLPPPIETVDQPSATVGKVEKVRMPLPPAPTGICARTVARHTNVMAIRTRTFFMGSRD